jgi:hypothetical protein
VSLAWPGFDPHPDDYLPQLLCFLRPEIGGWGVGANASTYAAAARGGAGEALLRAELPWIVAGIAALAFGYAIGVQASSAGASIFGSIHPKSFDVRAPLGSQVPDSRGVRVASLQADAAAGAAIEDNESPSRSSTLTSPYAPFDERVLFDPGAFDQPLGGSSAFRGGARPGQTGDRTGALSPAPTEPGKHGITRLVVASLAPKPAPVTASKDLSPPPDADSHTAIYDIAAHMVYLPNGQRLEAHSGLGDLLDDPRHVDAKDRGPTPPNVYDLALREEPFHGVRAIRLIPVDDGKMFGRDGMLAHSYMLGPNGQSNGCVSFNDYPAFLNAFLSGDVQRLVVVEHLGTAPSPKTASGWFADTLQAIFRRS